MPTRLGNKSSSNLMNTIPLVNLNKQTALGQQGILLNKWNERRDSSQ